MSNSVPPEAAAHVGGQYVFDPDAIPPMQTRFLKGVLSEGELALWIGREKHRKSSMVLLFSVSLALGKPFLGFATPAPLRVVILDYESKPGSLSREANAEILAYVLSMNQFPAGKADLPQASEVLKEIKVEASKPERKD